MFKRWRIPVLLACFLVGFGACAKKQDNSVIIYTSTEDFRTEHIQQLLKEKENIFHNTSFAYTKNICLYQCNPVQ